MPGGGNRGDAGGEGAGAPEEPAGAAAPGQGPAARRLAERIRDLAEALATRAVDDPALERATALVDRARAALEGPPRPRWYELGTRPGEVSAETRRAYLEQSPIRGHENPMAPPLELDRGTDSDGAPRVTATARLGLRFEGPPHGVHGGWVAALFDEVLGQAQGLVGGPGVTAILKVRYRQVTPVEETLRFEAWPEKPDGRRLVARATCHAGETLTADAEGIFIKVDFDEVAARMRRRRDRGGP